MESKMRLQFVQSTHTHTLSHTYTHKLIGSSVNKLRGQGTVDYADCGQSLKCFWVGLNYVMCAPSYDQSSTPPVPVCVCVRVQQMRKILISFWKFHSKKAKAATKVVCRRDADGCVYWGQWPGTHTQTHRLVYACMCVCVLLLTHFLQFLIWKHTNTHRDRNREEERETSTRTVAGQSYWPACAKRRIDLP